MNIACLNLRQIPMQYLSHGATCYIGTLLGLPTTNVRSFGTPAAFR